MSSITDQTLPNGSLARTLTIGDNDTPENIMAMMGFMDEVEINKRTKELKQFLINLKKDPKQFMPKVLFITNPHVGEHMSQSSQEKFQAWGRPAFHQLIGDLRGSRKQKVDGKDWSSGEMGSRWSDRVLNSVPTRVCFYSRKFNPDIMGAIGVEKEYVLMLDPQELDSF